MLGVTKLVPVPSVVPPVVAAYQFTVPAEAVAPSVTVPASHTWPAVVVLMVGVVYMVAATAVLAE